MCQYIIIAQSIQYSKHLLSQYGKIQQKQNIIHKNSSLFINIYNSKSLSYIRKQV